MTTEEQREEHTQQTEQAIDVIKDAFAEIERLKITLSDRDLQIQNLRNRLLMLSARLEG